MQLNFRVSSWHLCAKFKAFGGDCQDHVGIMPGDMGMIHVDYGILGSYRHPRPQYVPIVLSNPKPEAREPSSTRDSLVPSREWDMDKKLEATVVLHCRGDRKP